MHSTGSRTSDPYRISNEASGLVSKKSHATDGLPVQAQPSRNRVVHDSATRPTSLATRVIQALTAATFRARLEVRQAFKAADRALFDVIKSVKAGDESALPAASAKFTAVLSPLVRGSEKCPGEVDLRGTRLARQIPSDDKSLASLNESLDKLSDAALKDPLIAHLDFAVKAAILNKQAHAFEGQGRVFDGRAALDLRESSAGDLHELIDMGETASALDEVPQRKNQHLRDELPGTQLTPARLRSIVAFGKDAERELVKRETELKALASNNFALIKSMPIGKLQTLSEKVADFLGSPAGTKSRDKYLDLHQAITTQIQSLEDQITESVIGPIKKFDATKLTDQELAARRKAILATPNAPIALVNAGIDIKTQIDLRKELAKPKS